MWHSLSESVISKQCFNTFEIAVKEHCLNGNQFLANFAQEKYPNPIYLSAVYTFKFI